MIEHQIAEIGFVQGYQVYNGNVKYHLCLKGMNIWDLSVIDIIHIIETLEKAIS